MTTRLTLAMEDALVLAQEISGRWQSMVRLDGYPITCLAVDPVCPRRVYCGIAGRGLLISASGGTTWQPVGEGLISPSVTAVAVSRMDRRGDFGVLYAGTEPSALFFSEDGGRSWLECVALNHVPCRGQWRWPSRPYSHAVRWIEADGNEPSRLFVAVTMGGVLCSHDGGLSFQPLEGGFSDVHHLCTHPSAPGLTYQVGVGSETLLAYDLAGRIFPAPEQGGCALSHDAGASWQPISEGMARHRYLWRLALDPGDPETLLASASVGPLQTHLPGFAESVLYRKRAGRAWQQVSLGLPEPEGTTSYALATHNEEPGVFYAATGRGVYRSADAGESWHLMLPLPPRFHFKRAVALAVWRDR